MVTHRIFAAILFDNAPARFVDVIAPYHLLGCDKAEYHHELGIDQFDPLRQVIFGASIYFKPLRWAIRNEGSKNLSGYSQRCLCSLVPLILSGEVVRHPEFGRSKW
jgi:hypothetical protein